MLIDGQLTHTFLVLASNFTSKSVRKFPAISRFIRVEDEITEEEFIDVLRELLDKYRQCPNLEAKQKFIKDNAGKFALFLFRFFKRKLERVDLDQFADKLKQVLPVLKQLMQSEIPEPELVEDIYDLLGFILKNRKEIMERAEQYPERAEFFVNSYIEFLLSMALTTEAYSITRNPDELQVLESFLNMADYALDELMLKEYMDAVVQLAEEVVKKEDDSKNGSQV